MKISSHLDLLTGSDKKPHQVVEVEAGHSLADSLAAAGFPTNTRCGQRGWCRGCQVDLVMGELALKSGGVVKGPATVRACLTSLVADGHAVVHLPERARMSAAAKVGDSFVLDTPYTINPRFAITAERDTVCAIDLGTTTVVVLLADGASGEILARAGAFNTQMQHGDNVLSRIVHAGRSTGLSDLQHTVIHETLVPLLIQACAESGRAPERIAGITVAGNTTMLHLLVGEDPTPLGVAPFTPQFIDARDLPAADLGLPASLPGLSPDTIVHLLPGLSAYVGADIAAGLCATGMAYDCEASLLVDLGTNGEIVLQQNGRFLACATAAGPAFEGMGLSSGTRAQRGAIERVQMALHPFTLTTGIIGGEWIGNPVGLCGSGYVDFLAEGRRCGLINGSGRYDEDLWPLLPDENRCVREGVRALVLAPGVEVSERDIAALLQAKAAVGAGIETLLAKAGLKARDLSKLYLAGGFGLHLEVRNAIAIGLLPDMEAASVHVVGNSSLAGALLSALDQEAGRELARLRKRTDVVDLSGQADFEDRYLDHLGLPG
jgi:uncharacterized 2Fe-2S/4Fe-4S cluster protein (DUF4445 family)